MFSCDGTYEKDGAFILWPDIVSLHLCVCRLNTYCVLYPYCTLELPLHENSVLSNESQTRSSYYYAAKDFLFLVGGALGEGALKAAAAPGIGLLKQRSIVFGWILQEHSRMGTFGPLISLKPGSVLA